MRHSAATALTLLSRNAFSRNWDSIVCSHGVAARKGTGDSLITTNNLLACLAGVTTLNY